MRASQASDMGLLGCIDEGTEYDKHLGYSYRGGEGVFLRNPGEYSVGLHLRGQTRIFWKRKAWRIGKVCYVAEMGVKLTEELYTASENEAVAFRKKHGFEPGADNVRADANTLKKSLGWDRAERKGNNEVTADPFR